MKQGWEIKKIRDICDKASSNIVQNKISELDGDYPVYGASGYVQNVDFFHRDSRYIGIVKDGAGVGRVNIYPAYSSLLGTLQYIIPKDGYLLEYVAYALKGLNLASYASGATIPHIYFKNYGETEISVAPLSEQEKIVAELDCLSGIIEKKKQQLKEYDALAQSIFNEMFGNPIDNEKGWEVKKLGEVCKIICGQDYKSVKDDNGKYPIYGTGGIMGYASQYRCPANSIIIGRKGNINNPLFVNCEFWNVDTAFGVVPNTFILEPLFFFFFCKNYDFTKHDVSVTIPSLRRTDIIEINVPCPTLKLQQEFASKIEAIEKQKELIKQSIAETETLYNSRMDYYFS